MLKIFLTENAQNKTDSFLLKILKATTPTCGGLFQQIPTAPYKDLVKFVSSPEEANYFMIPHNYVKIIEDKAYKQKISDLTTKYNKKVLVFFYGDRTSNVDINNAIVLRTSAYKSKLEKNEIIVPAFVEDLGEQFGYHFKETKNTLPIVSFVGWVKYSSLKEEIKYRIRLTLSFIKIYFAGASQASYQGIYYRRKAIKSLLNCTKIESNFNLRNSYSANEYNVQGDKKKIREEFVESIQSSDLSLVVRGDGNWSLRFYETLSLGRIPLYIDTDTALPLEDEIDYSEFCITVDHTKIDKVAEIAASAWGQLTVEEFHKMQKNARAIFETRLRSDVFYKNLFSNLEKRVTSDM